MDQHGTEITGLAVRDSPGRARSAARDTQDRTLTLTEDNRLLPAVLEAISDHVYIVSRDGRILYAGAAGAKALGQTPQDLVGKMAEAIGTSDDLVQRHAGEREQALETGQPVTGTMQLQTVFGPREMEYTWSPIRPDQDGAPVDSLIFSARDVTAQVDASKALEASEARYRRIVEMALEGIWMVDREFRTTFVNARTAEMLGYSPAEMVGRPVHDFTDEEGRQNLEQRRAERQAGLSGQDDFKFIRSDGSLVWAIVSANPIMDDNGEFSGAIALLTDITERKRLEIAQARLAAIVDTSEEAIVSKNLDGIVTSWNAAAERIYGWPAKEIIGRSKALVIPPDLPDELPNILRRIRAGERIEHYETRRLRKDGTLFDAAISVSPVKDVDGNIVGAATIVHDITERKQIERRLQRQQAELEALNDRLRRSMRETHHRVKNNLQIIAAMVDMQVIDRGASGAVPVEEFKRLGGHIRTLAAVHDVLTHHLKEEEQEQLLSIRTVFEQLVPLLLVAAGNRPVQADIAEAQLSGKQALSLALVTNELVSNAVKHGTGLIEVTLSASPDAATLKVLNEGKGFAPDFDPVMSANTGLQLVASLVETDLRGQLAFAKRPAGGAEVSVTVPLPGAAGAPHFEELV